MRQLFFENKHDIYAATAYARQDMDNIVEEILRTEHIQVDV